MASAVADHGDIDESFVMAGVALVIAHEAACFEQPAESALYDPSLGQQNKAFGGVTAFDNRECQTCGVAEELARQRKEALELARVAAVSKNDL